MKLFRIQALGLCLGISACIPSLISSFVPSRSSSPTHPRNILPVVPKVVVASTTDTVTNDASSTSSSSSNAPNGLLKRDRYIATNRFAVRQKKEGKFEARWAKRKSRLASLPGFRYFHLMRRVLIDNDENDDATAPTTRYDPGNPKDGSNVGNYVSFTVWDRKSDFSAWRKGDAFKEAHGGTSIAAFASAMVSSAMVLKGPPRPAFYDGLLVQSFAPDAASLPEVVDGWRKVETDGKTVLPAECFVACNQFFVPSENALAFEKRWESRESKLKECDGFVAFFMLRRDGQAKGHNVVAMDEMTEPTYVSTTIWKDREAFEGWRKGNAFKAAHGVKSPADSAGGMGKEEKKEDAVPPKPLWSRPPSPVFYQGTLAITSEDGA